MKSFKQFLTEQVLFRYVGTKPVMGKGRAREVPNERGGVDWRAPDVEIKPGDIGHLETGMSRVEYTPSGRQSVADESFVREDGARVDIRELGGMKNLKRVDVGHGPKEPGEDVPGYREKSSLADLI